MKGHPKKKLNLAKVVAGVDLLRKGRSVADKENWKSKAKLGNALTLFIGAAIAFAAKSGYDLDIGSETIELLAYGLAGVWLGGWQLYRVVTSDTRGLPPKPDPDSER